MGELQRRKTAAWPPWPPPFDQVLVVGDTNAKPSPKACKPAVLTVIARNFSSPGSSQGLFGTNDCAVDVVLWENDLPDL
ncbi:MAG: hypothetical protein R3F37_06475 [Candidatus Competibacteraceae bacterium]